ncbi:MAG: GNAT family N-acetyltransferase [Nostoc sp. ZfuVER08]|jgi:ribosomal protein S18 acetylase RimI-like enzyme|uniref:GNAT family N-acetyltransferase n=1 Tax=Nostoc punctiforme FACHB-252 TaxID=1357509 RepID=A0ABR8HFN6_NOSPU|nr:GNAT family N-acetyltransferase [Nostoc punctiforme]MBD2614598.1 GNAT family N-acetyltransferase [Nostoc punctiforme FACHB-252]MBL1202027.1 GNAT family N-acetyltransferase [Nostoc sp. GBBB01]MDZ8012783.1 GNAT family N-acetyltransferase [Nostoc sp. ZfuVER08]
MSEEIQSFSIEYLEPCAYLYVEVFNSKPWNEQWSFNTARTRLFEITNTPGFVGFIFKQDELLGFLAGYCKQGQKSKSFYLEEICVRPDNQRQKIGTKLLDKLMQTLTSIEVKSVYLLTNKDGQAEAFYTKHGYQRKQEMIFMTKKF